MYTHYRSQTNKCSQYKCMKSHISVQNKIKSHVNGSEYFSVPNLSMRQFPCLWPVNISVNKQKSRRLSTVQYTSYWNDSLFSSIGLTPAWTLGLKIWKIELLYNARLTCLCFLNLSFTSITPSRFRSAGYIILVVMVIYITMAFS